MLIFYLKDNAHVSGSQTKNKHTGNWTNSSNAPIGKCWQESSQSHLIGKALLYSRYVYLLKFSNC